MSQNLFLKFEKKWLMKNGEGLQKLVVLWMLCEEEGEQMFLDLFVC